MRFTEITKSFRQTGSCSYDSGERRDRRFTVGNGGQSKVTNIPKAAFGALPLMIETCLCQIERASLENDLRNGKSIASRKIPSSWWPPGGENARDGLGRRSLKNVLAQRYKWERSVLADRGKNGTSLFTERSSTYLPTWTSRATEQQDQKKSPNGEARIALGVLG
ncbi:hypothetical protein HZH66_001454 [Vespula vulgaris]|uniref:Uncharacterized protein n=1 Tax=Vespula vulgaris TaxID=7454 RepID=A0A834KTA3_VESVU|nr:hypothetical protein HZH66_001454 [Vespula vulgaris]